MLGWMKHKLESRFRGEISVTSDMHDTTLKAKKKKKRKKEKKRKEKEKDKNTS